MAGTAARVAIDPRLRARRVAVKRSAGRRRLRRLVTAAITVAVLLGWLDRQRALAL
jgi:hypothetical protein